VSLAEPNNTTKNYPTAQQQAIQLQHRAPPATPPYQRQGKQHYQKQRRFGQEEMKKSLVSPKEKTVFTRTAETKGVCLGQEFEWKKLGDFLLQEYKNVHFVNHDTTIHVPITTNKHMFFFDDGCIAFWNLTALEQKEVCNTVRPFVTGLLAEPEVEEMPYATAENPKQRIQDDTFVLDALKNEKDSVLDMIAFSQGMLRSVKLAVFESQVDEIIMPTKDIIDTLASTGKIYADEHLLNKSLGELLRMRSYINLFTNINDTPDVYWDDSERETLWHKVSWYLDVVPRLAMVNRKIEFAKDTIDIVKRDVNEHDLRRSGVSGARMELLIIVLIAIEVVFGIPNFAREFGLIGPPTVGGLPH